DGANATTHGAPDRLGGVGVGTDVFAPVVGLLAVRLDLVGAELEALQRVVGRGHAAGDHELDVVGALPQLLAHRLEHLRHAVDDWRQVVQAGATGACDRALGPAPEVAVAAGLAHGPAGDEQAWPVHQPVVDRGLHAEVAAGGVAHGGEAAHQHGAQQYG